MYFYIIIIMNYLFKLGPSGCGKTTLLQCIVGKRLIDGGSILVFGGAPGSRQSGVPGPRVGYMPQELALYGEFTIKETLQYFGRLGGHCCCCIFISAPQDLQHVHRENHTAK